MSFLATLALVAALLPTAALAPGGTFTDDDQIVHEGGIEAIAADGITVGCNPPFNDRFCPSRLLTRAEMATMVARALSLPAPQSDHFIDDEGHILEGSDQPNRRRRDHAGLQSTEQQSVLPEP